MRSLRKILTRLRGTNFCTTSSRFAPSFVRQPNGPECTKILGNAPKRQFKVQWVGSGASIAKGSTRLRGTNFCTSSAHFAPRFVTQPNGPQCTKILRNAPEHEFRVQWDGSGAFVPPSLVRQLNGTKCTQIVRNAPKCEFRVQWDGSGALRKIPTRLRGTNFCTSSACFAPSL